MPIDYRNMKEGWKPGEDSSSRPGPHGLRWWAPTLKEDERGKVAESVTDALKKQATQRHQLNIIHARLYGNTDMVSFGARDYAKSATWAGLGIPNRIAFNIVAMAEDLESVTESEVVKYSASGFRDFTRIAASDPTMWRDVFLNNREAVLEVLGRFSEDLAALQRAIRWGEGDTLYDLFDRARRMRREVIDAGQDTPTPNWGREN